MILRGEIGNTIRNDKHWIKGKWNQVIKLLFIKAEFGEIRYSIRQNFEILAMRNSINYPKNLINIGASSWAKKKWSIKQCDFIRHTNGYKLVAKNNGEKSNHLFIVMFI